MFWLSQPNLHYLWRRFYLREQTLVLFLVGKKKVFWNRIQILKHEENKSQEVSENNSLTECRGCETSFKFH